MAGERVLVCDDDPQILRALRLVLRGAGYEVLTTTTGEEALDRAALSGPHAAIIDLMLPDRPGIEVCRELRSWSELPIIVLSAVDEEETKIAALQSGADDYVTKPFAPGELVARLQAVLRRAGRAEAEPRIEVDGLVIDVAAHTVTLDGEEVHLTPLEFSLLRELAANRGLLMKCGAPSTRTQRRCYARISQTSEASSCMAMSSATGSVPTQASVTDSPSDRAGGCAVRVHAAARSRAGCRRGSR